MFFILQFILDVCARLAHVPIAAAAVKIPSPAPVDVPLLLPSVYTVPLPSPEGRDTPQLKAPRDSLLWPVARVQSMADALDPSRGKQSYDANVRYLAASLGLRTEQLLRLNPVLFGRRMGLSEETLSRVIAYDYQLLSSSYLA
jgi:hypothetical protein